jgi:hypothetical protein
MSSYRFKTVGASKWTHASRASALRFLRNTVGLDAKSANKKLQAMEVGSPASSSWGAPSGNGRLFLDVGP